MFVENVFWKNINITQLERESTHPKISCLELCDGGDELKKGRSQCEEDYELHNIYVHIYKLRGCNGQMHACFSKINSF